MSRRSFLLAALALAAGAPAQAARANYDKGLLWRITRNGVPASHLYGTIHVSDPRLEKLPAPVERAFERSRRLMLEFIPDPYARERFLEASMFLDQQTLLEKIGAEDFERAVAHLAPIGLSREFINKLKPWGVLLNLRDSGSAGGASHEQRLFDMARARRMPLEQIEGVEEQIFTFDEFPMDSQVALLKHSLAHRDELLRIAERTLQAYLLRDLKAIWAIREEFARRHPQIAAHQAVLTKRVVYDRNVVMAFRMQRALRHGGAFVALGALHLYGGKGVLALLAEDGYAATRLY